MPESLKESKKFLQQLQAEEPLQPISLKKFKEKIAQSRRKLWHDLFSYRIEVAVLCIIGLLPVALPLIIYRQQLVRHKRRERRNAFYSMITDWSRYEPIFKSVMVRAQPRQRVEAAQGVELLAAANTVATNNGQ